MAKLLPIGDVTELGEATPKGLRAAGFDMGPGNAQVPPGGSAQAQAFRAGMAPPAPAAPVAPTPATMAQRALRSTRAGVVNGARSAGTAALPVIAGGSAMESLGTPTENYYNRLGLDPKGVGENGFKDLAVRGAGVLSDFGANLLDVPMAAVNGVRRFAGAEPLATFGEILRQGDGAAPAAPVQPGLGGQPNTAPIYSDARQGPAVPPSLPAQPGSLASGFSLADKTPHPGTVSSLDTIGFDGYKRQLDNIRSLGSDDPTGGTPQNAGGFGGETLSSGLRAIANSQNLGPGVKERMALNGGTGADRRLAATIQADRANLALRESGENTRQGVRESGENARLSTREGGENYRSDRGLRTQMAISDRRIGAEMRGQDIAHAGHVMTNQNARTRLQYDMGKDQRDFGAAQTERDRGAVEAANKSWQSEAETRFRTKDEKGADVPDHARIAMFNAAVDTSIPSFIKMLQATGTPAALKKAQELSSRGRAALGSEDKDLMQRLLDKRETIRQTHGMLPGTSNYVHSDDLLGYLTSSTDPHLLGSDSEVTRNGSKVRRDKLTYGKDGNVFLPNFQPPSTNLTGLR